MKQAITIKKLEDVDFVDTKYGLRAVAELCLFDMPKQKIWMTEKQGRNLLDCFHDDRYSSKNKEVVGIFEKKENGDFRFIWSICFSPKIQNIKSIEWAKKTHNVFISPQYVYICDDSPVLLED